MNLTLEQVSDIFQAPKALAQTYLQPLNDTFNKFQINTPLRIAHFCAQIYVESQCLTHTQENGNYSAQRILEIFPKYFSSTVNVNNYAMNPKALFSRVYANRYGNGDEATQDGFKFSGKGLIQITFKANYEIIARDLNIDCVNHPELLLQPEYAALSAGAYWNDRHLNNLADQDLVDKISILVNGGSNGLIERRSALSRAKAVLGIK